VKQILMTAARTLVRMEAAALMELTATNALVLLDIQALIVDKILMIVARILAKMEVFVLME